MITLNELLKNRNFDYSKDTILVRHKDKRIILIIQIFNRLF